MPVTNQSKREQQKGDQKQAGSLRGINRVAALLAVGVVLALKVRHANIVRRAPAERDGAENIAATVGEY